MFERGISVQNIQYALESGEIIEDYSTEMSEPSRLMLAFQGKLPLHVVASGNSKANKVIIITAYVPDSDKWYKGFRSRRS
jgi:hypothetical protein